MKVSVVIPAYNEEKYLAECLRSLARQTEKADEIIVVDNNSTDKTSAIAKRHHCRVVTESQQGISYARNAGFNAAKGDIIARCDADTVVPPNWIKEIKTQFATYEVDAVGGTALFRDLPLIKTTVYSNLYLEAMKIVQRGRETLVGMNMAITRDIWRRVRGTLEMDNHKVHEDIDLALKIWQIGGKIRYDKSLVVHSSARRLKRKPWSFFIEYPLRTLNTISQADRS